MFTQWSRRRPGTAPFEEGGPHPLEGTPLELAFAVRSTVMVTRADLENSPSPLVQRILADGVKSGCVAPLIARGRILGALHLASQVEGAFSKEDGELLTQIAGQVALSVENAVAYREISSLKAQLQEETSTSRKRSASSTTSKRSSAAAHR